MVELCRYIYTDKVVTPEGITLTSVEADHPLELEHLLGDRLSDLTYEQGM